MAVSSFFGYFTLKTGAVVIGIVQLIGTLFLCNYTSGLGYGYRVLWSPMFSLQLIIVVFLFIGIARRNADYVFPFVSGYFVTVMFLVYHVTGQVIESILNINHFQDAWLIILWKIVLASIMYYFLGVIYSFYEQLLRKKYTVSSSISPAIDEHMKNNEEVQQQTIKQILAEEGIPKCRDNIMK